MPFASREDGDRGRAVALHRLRALLSAGRPIRMVGDGEIGRELFRVPAPIGALVIRSGWWSLRRHVGATVVPVMSYREGSGAVVTAYPPLSEPVPDAQDDLDRCRTELVPLIQDFVIHHPDQCLPWIFDLA